MVFLEALASGLPAVGTKVGGLTEVFDGGRAGWLAESGNVESIRETITRAVSQDDERRRRSEHGRRHVEQFSTPRLLERFHEIVGLMMEQR